MCEEQEKSAIVITGYRVAQTHEHTKVEALCSAFTLALTSGVTVDFMCEKGELFHIDPHSIQTFLKLEAQVKF